MISTGQVYLVTERVKPPYREEDSLGPLMPAPEAGTPDHAQWSYGAGKRRAEEALLTLAGARGVRAVALRLPIAIGEADGSLRLWAHLERLMDGGTILLPGGTWKQTRFLYAGDLGPVLERLAGASSPRPAYNLAQPDVLSLRGFVERLAVAAGIAPRFIDVGEEVWRAHGLELDALPYTGRWVSILDPARAVSELDFTGTPVDTYLPRVVRWHLDHRPATSHAGYAQRARELELAARQALSMPRYS
jgi:nucleoside-diphosphate-sugar epimerase